VAAEAEAIFEKEGRVVTVEENRAAIPSAATWKPVAAAPPAAETTDSAVPAAEDAEDEPLEDLEHLQLTLPEAWFLLWTMDSLTVLHPDTVRRALSYNTCNQYECISPRVSLNP
jgi:tRNA-splicing endonuclease subunit Sen2